jgi:pyruvate-formate lyase-activating enzyme
MSNSVAKTVMMTTKCSGGCSHCPFSNPSLEPLFLPTETISRILNQTTEKLAILSGGEPFEHPEIMEILTKTSDAIIPFRIATGGFVPLDPWIEKLQTLSEQNTAFKGISIGTDVLSNRISHSNWVPIWKSNVQLLILAQVPFSLTLTISPEFQLDRFAFFSWKEIFKGMPEFIYVRHSNDGSQDIWTEKIQVTFGNVPIIQDDISNGNSD